MRDVFSQISAALAERYVLKRELGHGGMATVFLAHDIRHDRPVALKVLHPELAATLFYCLIQQRVIESPVVFPREELLEALQCLRAQCGCLLLDDPVDLRWVESHRAGGV